MELTLADFRDRAYPITAQGVVCADAPQTAAIQATIDRCYAEGGGRVVVPAGLYRTGGLRLRSGVMLYLESGAILRGSTDPADYDGFLQDTVEPIDHYDPKKRGSTYPYSHWCNAIVRVLDAEKVAIVGEPGSYIDGADCYDPTGEEGYRGPHAVSVWNSRRLLLCGYTITDSANWAHAIFNTQYITARDLTVYGGHDGFDVRTCDDVLIEDCRFFTGDDCIAGFDNHDVVIRRCRFDSACHALRFGGHRVLVEDCESTAPSRYGHRWGLSDEAKQRRHPTSAACRHNMLAVFAYYCDHRAVIRQTPGEILLKNCRFQSADSLFKLEFDGDHRWCCNRSLSSIAFENCTVENVCEPILIHGDEAEPLSFRMTRCTVSARPGCEQTPFLTAHHAATVTLTDVQTPGYATPTLVLHTPATLHLDPHFQTTPSGTKNEK